MARGHAERTDEQGISLVELMLTTIVAVVLIGAVFTTTYSQNRTRQAVSERSLAVGALLNNLERARTLPQADILALDGVGFDVPGLNGRPGGLAPVRGDADGLPGQITVQVDPSSVGTAQLYRVIGTVRWRGVGGDSVILLQTLIGERR